MNAVSRDEVVSLLMEKVNNGQVIVTLGELSIVPLIRIPPNTTCPNSVQPTMTTVSATSVIVSTRPCPTSTCSVVEESSSSSLSSGATAGLTVAVFIVGVIVGVISTVLTCSVMRNRGRYSTSSLAYNKQRDDVVI